MGYRHTKPGVSTTSYKVCPKCKKGILEFGESIGVYTEYYYCSVCNIDYEVDVELVRDWADIREVIDET